MHPPEKIQQFFELRSRGNCLGYISTAIGVRRRARARHLPLAPSAVAATPDSPVAHEVPIPPTAEPKPEKTGIADSPPAAHSPTFSPAHLPTAVPLFSIDDHLPTPMAEWLPDGDNELIVYGVRPAKGRHNAISKKTIIASTA